jgi:molybdopterin converting factor small subunit
MTTLRIPTPLRPYVEGVSEIEIKVETVGQALDEVTGRYPDLRKHLYSEEGELRPFVNLFINDEDVRYLQGIDTPVKEDDKLMILPSIAGGR